MLLAVTSSTWIVTGLGFGIVLALLFCLVFILQFFGWVMQRVERPQTPQAAPATAQTKPQEKPQAAAPVAAQAGDEEMAAIAMALYLCGEQRHDLPTPIIYPQARNTAWNAKEIGLNNKGF